MSDDRLAKIEAKLDSLATKEDLEHSEGRLGARMDTLASKEDLRNSIWPLEKRLDKLEVNQEQMKDDIKIIAEGHAATQALIHRKTDELREELGARVGLVERAVKTSNANLR